MSGFFQVDRGIFDSSVWIASTAEERVLWFWLIGNCDDAGVVQHRDLAIAFKACLPREVVAAALEKFAAPDSDSRTNAQEGRRIERTPDGYVRLLNHELYYSKDYSTPRWRRWKERKGVTPTANAKTSKPTKRQRSANAPTPLATKDKDKDKDKDNTDTLVVVPPSTLEHPPQSSVSVELKLDERGLPELPAVLANEAAAAHFVFDYWRHRTAHLRAQWSEERKRRLIVRLREEPGDLRAKAFGLVEAIEGALLDPLHNGLEKGRSYLEFENLFVHQGRNRIEKLQGVYRGAAAPVPGASSPDSVTSFNEREMRKALSMDLGGIGAVVKSMPKARA